MLSKILGNVKDTSTNENKELVDRISKMNLTDMRFYINNKIPDFFVDEDGLSEVLHRLLKVDKKTSKRYIDVDDIDSKIKKGFDLVLNILINKKITINTIELANEFLQSYKNIIEKYDKENKQIYYTKFKRSIALAIKNMNAKVDLEVKIDVISQP